MEDKLCKTKQLSNVEMMYSTTAYQHNGRAEGDDLGLVCSHRTWTPCILRMQKDFRYELIS